MPSVKYPRLVWVRPQALGARQAHTGTRATTVQVRDDVKVLRYPVHRRQPAFRCASLLSAFCTRHARSCPPPVHAASPSPLTLPSFRLARLSGKRGGPIGWARCLTSSSHLDCLASRCSSRALTLPLDSRPSRLNVARDRCTLLPLMPPRPSRLLHTWPSRLLHTWPSRLLLIAPFSLAA